VLALRLAWRNVWRNPRRTGVVVCAVAVGIAGVLLSMSINYGMVVGLVDTAIATELGHLQIHGRGFDENPELRIRLHDGGRAGSAALARLEGVEAWARRVRGQGLVNSPRASAGVSVVGIEPEREAEISLIARSITRGSYLDGRRRVLIGEALARRLEVDVGDKIVVSVQDLGGDLTGEALRVGGFFRSPSRELDRGTVFLHLGEAQALLGLGEAVSEIAVVAKGRSSIPAIRDALAQALPAAEVRTWGELRPLLVYMVDMFDEMAVYVYVAVFVAMAFGIANVLMMAVYERRREIGILMAIGMGRTRVVATIVTESALVTLLGLIIGFAVAVASLAALQDGIDFSLFAEGLTAYGFGTRIVPALRVEDFFVPTGVAIVTALLASAWPALRAVRFRPAEAVRQV
jgi:ABC-type lipoprotein release transport system permease subunit